MDGSVCFGSRSVVLLRACHILVPQQGVTLKCDRYCCCFFFVFFFHTFNLFVDMSRKNWVLGIHHINSTALEYGVVTTYGDYAGGQKLTLRGAHSPLLQVLFSTISLSLCADTNDIILF